MVVEKGTSNNENNNEKKVTGQNYLDKVNPRELAEVGSVMAVLAGGLANLEQNLPR